MTRVDHGQRLLAAFGRARRLDRSLPYLLDGVFAAALFAMNLLSLHRPNGGPFPLVPVHLPFGIVAIPLAGQALPLAWRRVAPTAVFVVVLASCVVQWASGYSSPSMFGLMFALYAVARYGRARTLLWASLASAVALVVPAFHLNPYQQQQWAALFFLYCGAAAACALGLYSRGRAARLEALADRAERLELEREQRVELATLAERSRVSREMHDIVGHHLAVIIGLADGAAFAAGADASDRSTETLRVVAETGRQALSELRHTLNALREHPERAESADLAPQPGISEIPSLLERVRAAGARVEYRTVGETDRVPATVQLAAYRIVQEATTNSLKHAGSTTVVDVCLKVSGDQLSVGISDEGPSPQREAERGPHRVPGPSSGRGLIGLVERASLIGGRASAGPRGHRPGWVVEAVLPLDFSNSQEAVSA